MNKFKSLLDLTSLSDGNYRLDYFIFAPGREYKEASVTVQQIPEYDKDTQAIPGVRIEVKLEDNGAANPSILQGSINITSPIVITTDKPFVEVRFLVLNSTTGLYADNGGCIVRGYVPA